MSEWKCFIISFTNRSHPSHSQCLCINLQLICLYLKVKVLRLISHIELKDVREVSTLFSVPIYCTRLSVNKDNVSHICWVLEILLQWQDKENERRRKMYYYVVYVFLIIPPSFLSLLEYHKTVSCNIIPFNQPILLIFFTPNQIE